MTPFLLALCPSYVRQMLTLITINPAYQGQSQARAGRIESPEDGPKTFQSISTSACRRRIGTPWKLHLLVVVRCDGVVRNARWRLLKSRRKETLLCVSTVRPPRYGSSTVATARQTSAAPRAVYPSRVDAHVVVRSGLVAQTSDHGCFHTLLQGVHCVRATVLLPTGVACCVTAWAIRQPRRRAGRL